MRHLHLSTDQAHWLMLFTLCNFAVHGVIFYGQTSAIVLFLLTLHVLAQRRAERPVAGVWAGLLCVKPQYMAVPHLILLVRRRWREFLVGAAIGSLLIIGMFLWIGFEASAQYFQLARRMVSADSDWWNQWRGMHNLRVLVIYALPEGLARRDLVVLERHRRRHISMGQLARGEAYRGSREPLDRQLSWPADCAAASVHS